MSSSAAPESTAGAANQDGGQQPQHEETTPSASLTEKSFARRPWGMLVVGWSIWVLSIIATAHNEWFFGVNDLSGVKLAVAGETGGSCEPIRDDGGSWIWLDRRWCLLHRVFTAAQILATVFISVAMVPLTMAFLGRVDKTERWAKRVLTICSGFFQLLAVSLATSHYVDVRQNYDFRQDFQQGIADTLDYLLGSTYAVAWLAFLLTPVEVALHQIFDRAFKRGDGSRPLYTQSDRNLNAFWVVLGLGVAVMTFEAVILTNSVHSRDDMSTGLQIVPLALAVCAMVWLGYFAKGSSRDCKTARLMAAAVLAVGVAHVVVQALGVRSWYPDTIERVEVREGMLALWLWAFVLSFVFFGGLAFIFWSGRYTGGSDAEACRPTGGQGRQDGGTAANPPAAVGSAADGLAAQVAV